MPHTDLPAKARPLVIDPHDTEAINQWLASERLDVPLTQPTAFRLAQVLAAQKSPAISLTPDVRQRLGRDPAEWEEDLADLYRRDLLAMWQYLGSPWLVMLTRDGPAKGHRGSSLRSCIARPSLASPATG
jgi:hypothetical protein